MISFFKQNIILEDEDKLQYLVHLVRLSLRKGFPSLKKYMREVIKLNSATLAHSYCKFVKNMIKILPEEAIVS